MGKIIILDENTSNKIAAGEVIERPASVIKELVENSIDAGADNITVEIRNGGISYIKVTDNGSGIEEDDAVIAFERHGTSKIRSADDLENIHSLGFRGEALASIAAVSRVQLVTRVREKPYGVQVEVEGGHIKEVKQTGCPVGTTFVIRDLFYNTPARFKFLKKDSTEAGYISEVMERIALGNPDISMKLSVGGNTVIHTPGNRELLSTIFCLYGKETARNVSEINYCDQRFKITGYAGKPEIARSNRNHQSIYINGRYVRSKIISAAIDEAYKTLLMKGKFAFIVLRMEINPVLVDVNVHPTKMEVRFSNEQEVFRSIYHAVNNALLEDVKIRPVTLNEKNANPYKFDQPYEEKKQYTQEAISPKLMETHSRTQEGSFNKNEGIRSYMPPTEEDPKESTAFVKEETVQKGVALKKVESMNEIVEPFKEAPLKECVTSIKEAPLKEMDPLPKSGLSPEEKPSGGSRISKTVDVLKEPDAPKTCDRTANTQNEEEPRMNILMNARRIGQAFSTYIILQAEDELVIIDQHAAHERIMFEKLRKAVREHTPMSQYLAAPVTINLSYREIGFLEEQKEIFQKIGFIYENFGNNSIILRAVPFTGEGGTVRDTFLEIVDSLMNTYRSSEAGFTDETLYRIACKAAVKANKKLDQMEIEGLLSELQEMSNPLTCPHGRPTAIKISKAELEKMFKRIV